MDIFNRRLSQDEASSIVHSATRGGLLDGANAAIFHHLGLMRARVLALAAAFPANTLHAAAIKANPVVEILRELVAVGMGLEAASLEEVELARSAGCAAERIIFDSPAKTAQEIEQALHYGVYLNVDNFDELARVATARNKCEPSSVIGLRINAMVGGGAIAHTSVSEADSKFGVPLLSQQRRILTAFAEHNWLNGLHVHVGSQGCELGQLVEAVKRVNDLRREIVAASGRNIGYIDIGGGLPTSYADGKPAPTPEHYCARLRARTPELFANDVRLVTEFGRAIHANCGAAVSRVEYVKPAQRLAVIHLGADFLLRPVYRPKDWRHDFFVLDAHGRPKAGRPSPVTVAGPLCFAGDIVARDVPLPPVEPGDWIVIRDVGAYTLSMWSRHCSRAIPAVIGYDPEAGAPLRVLRRAETAADVVRFWS